MTLAHTAASPSHAARGHAPREMPVLFHLFDVSTPKGFAAPHPSAEDEPVGEAPPTQEVMATAVPEATLPEATLPEVPPPAPAVELPVATSTTSEPIAEHKPNPTDTTPPADDAVSVRQRIEERSRKRQTASKDDWFGLHGKYIAIGFVLTLLLTIYFARWHKRSPQPPVAAPPHAHPGDAATTAPAIVVELPKAGGHEQVHTSSPAVGITMPDAAPAQSPAVELHMPTTTAPQLAQQPEAAKPAEQKPDEGLFPWAKQNEERVATRPEQATLPPPTTTTAPAPSLPAAPPAGEPRYPTTNSRSQFQPAAAPQSPPASGPAGGSFVPAAAPEPSYPTTSTATGTRYERTGSGLY